NSGAKRPERRARSSKRTLGRPRTRCRCQRRGRADLPTFGRLGRGSHRKQHTRSEGAGMTTTNPADQTSATQGTDLGGVLTALATPFDVDGHIDTDGIRQLVDRSIDAGVDGVVACGSTGEFAAMTGDERRLVVETVVDQTAGRVPVVAQTGA